MQQTRLDHCVPKTLYAAVAAAAAAAAVAGGLYDTGHCY